MHTQFNPVSEKTVINESVNKDKISKKNPARAFCRVILGGFTRATPYLHKSIQQFGDNRKSISDRTSFIVVDDDSIMLLKKSNRPGHGTSLYEQLIEYGVTFITTNELRDFLTRHGETDYFHKVIEIIKNNIHFEDSDSFDYFHTLSDAYKLLCISYVFANKPNLTAVASLDIDSIAPIHPPALVHHGKIPTPTSLRIQLWVKSVDSFQQTSTIPFHSFISDIRFMTSVYYKIHMKDEIVKTTLEISIDTVMNFCFIEIRSAKAAKELKNNLQEVFSKLLSEIPLLLTDKTGKTTGLYNGLAKLPLNRSTVIKKLWANCGVAHNDLTNQFTCNKGVTNHSRLQEKLLLNNIANAKFNTQLKYLIPWLNKHNMELFIDHLEDIPPIIRGKKRASECSASTSVNEICFDFFSGIMKIRLDKKNIKALNKVFSEPLNSWHLQATEAHYQWKGPDGFFGKPQLWPALGEYHANQLFNGNISAIQSLTTLEPLSQEIPEDTRASYHSSEEYTNNIIDGMVAGVFDECCARLSLTDFSLIHKTLRGYLVARGSGCALGLVSHIYGRYMEPFLPPDSNVKYLCDKVLPHSPLLASIAQGNLVGTLCTVASYSTTRYLINQLFSLPGQRHNRRARKSSRK